MTTLLGPLDHAEEVAQRPSRDVVTSVVEGVVKRS